MVLVIENIYKLADRAASKGLPQIKGAPKVNYVYSDVNTSSGYVSGSYGDSGGGSSETSSYQSSSSYEPSYTDTSTTTPTTTTTTTETTQSSGGGDSETICPDCGAAREAGAQFCGDCGHQYF